MFSFFTRKTSPARVPLSELPPVAATVLSKEPQQVALQLRTPSPSIDSVSVALGTTVSESASLTPIRPVDSEISQTSGLSTLEPTLESLTKRVSSVPTKTLHAFVLSRLPETSNDILKALAAFFEPLTPPPRLHCVRCHKDYVEVENDDRSCLVHHDDETAEVERVGRNGEHRRTKEGTEYETLWGCCGRITEGDGSQGPPDGWCYEGKHTTDIKRARFRADSTPYDDKLTSCLRLNCHGIRSQFSRLSTARGHARSTKKHKEPGSNGGADHGDLDSGADEIDGKEKQKKVRIIKSKVRIARDDVMDVDEAPATEGGLEDIQENPPAPPTPLVFTHAPLKRRGRPSKANVLAEETDKESTPAPKPVSQRRGRPSQSRSPVQHLDVDSTRGRRSMVSPTRPRTRSTSRVGRPLSRSRLESTVFVSLDTPQRVKLRKAPVVEKSDVDMDADAEKPRKKRKIAT